MPCDGIYTSGNRRIGSICSRGRRKKQPPCACGHESSLLCDGHDDFAKSCDMPMCGCCAVSLRVFDLDFCRDCAAADPGLGNLCALRSIGPALSLIARACMGESVGARDGADLCLRHAVLFDHWHAFEGGQSIYENPALNRDQRREEHRRWLRTASDEQVRAILTKRHALLARAA